MTIYHLNSLFLASRMNLGLAIGLIVAGVVVALAGGLFIGMFINKVLTEKRLGDVRSRTKKMIDDALHSSEALKKEAILEAKEQELQLRNEFEKESREKKTKTFAKRRNIRKKRRRFGQEERIFGPTKARTIKQRTGYQKNTG